MSTTAKLLSKILESGKEFMDAKKLGVSEFLFYLPDEKLVWKIIEDYFKHHAKVPPIENIYKLVPTFTPIDPGTLTTSELVERVNKERMEISIRSAMVEVEDLLAQEKYREAIAKMHSGAAEASKGFGLSKDSSMRSYGDHLLNIYKGMKEEPNTIRGIPWPWDPLNAETGGILNGTYSVIYGRMKSTKTFRLLEIALSAQKSNKRTLIVSCEMLEEVLFLRLAALACCLDYDKFKKGKLDEESEEILKSYIDGWKYTPDYKEIIITKLSNHPDGKTVSTLRAKIEEHEPDIILIDSMYKMMDEQTGKRDASPQTVRNISYDIQQLAQATNRPTVVTTQSNRKGERAVSGVTTDVAFSDAFAMDCDILLRLANDRQLERTIFLIQAARECSLLGFSTGNKCCDGLGPVRVGGVLDWSLPKRYLSPEEPEESSKKKDVVKRFSE